MDDLENITIGQKADLIKQNAQLKAMKWSEETIAQINKLTPDIKGKAFDPAWFLLRQRFEQIDYAVEENAQLKAQLEQAQLELGKLKQYNLDLGERVLELIAERDQAQAACSAFRAIWQKAVNQVFSELTSINSENRTAWIWQEGKKLFETTTCGRGWFNAEQLKPTIELLEWIQLKQEKNLVYWPDLPRELTRLKALVEPIK